MKFETLVCEVAAVLKAQGRMVVTAESCTGGMISQALTSLAGSTAWFDRAFITYSYESKIAMLGVCATTLENKGAVSQACVEEMALGALQQSDATVSVSCSGIAGPGGGTSDKPVGTVWVAWAVWVSGREHITSHCFHFLGDRQSIREQTTEAALKGVVQILLNSAVD